ncbi:hypothetical protein FRC19_000256 [Serendipita sp. 401]|nr:hypothetical protein FRC19_000256 [Serendipita sp. 401]KAG8871766.1 hypothetical protein FRC20_010211 [Serendipita sp. 405]KAG9056360.1 hypothetical protein FS842_010876 [Serendipita sp. 407]
MDFSLRIPPFGLQKRESRWDYLEPLQKAAMALELTWAALSGLLFIFIVFKLFRIRVKSTPRGPYILLALVSFTFVLGDALNAVQLREDIDVFDWFKVISASSIFRAFSQVFVYAVLLWLTHIRGQAFGGSRPGSSSTIVARTWKRVVDWVLVAVTFIYIVALNAYSTTKNLSHIRRIYNNDYSSAEHDDYEEFVKISQKLQHVSTALSLLLAIDVVASLFVLWFAQRRAKFTDSVVTRLLITSAPFVPPLTAMWLFYDIWVAKGIQSILKANLAYVIIEGVCQIGIFASVVSTIDLHTDNDPSGSSSYLNQASNPAYKA